MSAGPPVPMRPASTPGKWISPTMTDANLRAMAAVAGFNPDVLEFVSCTSITDDGFQALVSKCDRLQRLSVVDCGGVTEVSLVPVLRTCPVLSWLDIRDIPVGDSTLDALGDCATALTELHATAIKATDDFLATLLKGCQNLTVIDLDECGSMRDALTVVARSGLPSVVSLSLRGCVVTEAGCSAFATWPSATASLHSLNLSGSSGLSEAGAAELLKACRSLRDLDLSRCDISSAVMQKIGAHGGQQLVTLSVSGCRRISEDSLLQVLPQLSQLKELNLGGCNATDAVVTCIGAHLTLLRALDLSNCNVTVATLRVIAGSMHCLEVLNVSYNSKIDGNAIDSFVSASGGDVANSLHGLDLSCTSVDSSALLFLSQGMPKLETLGLLGLDIADTGLLHLSHGCSELRELHIDSPLVGNFGLRALQRGCPHLDSRALEEHVRAIAETEAALHVSAGAATERQELIGDGKSEAALKHASLLRRATAGSSRSSLARPMSSSGSTSGTIPSTNSNSTSNSSSNSGGGGVGAAFSSHTATTAVAIGLVGKRGSVGERPADAAERGCCSLQ